MAYFNPKVEAPSSSSSSKALNGPQQILGPEGRLFGMPTEIIRQMGIWREYGEGMWMGDVEDG
jgi:hypothetical protein